MCVCGYMFACLCLYECVCLFVFLFVCLCMFVCSGVVCLCVFLYVCGSFCFSFRSVSAFVYVLVSTCMRV